MWLRHICKPQPGAWKQCLLAPCVAKQMGCCVCTRWSLSERVALVWHFSNCCQHRRNRRKSISSSLPPASPPSLWPPSDTYVGTCPQNALRGKWEREKPHPDWLQDATGEVLVWGNSGNILTKHAKNTWGWGSWVTRGEAWATRGSWRRLNVNGFSVTCQSICCSLSLWAGNSWGCVAGWQRCRTCHPALAHTDGCCRQLASFCAAFSFFLCWVPWLDLGNFMHLPVRFFKNC